jgi:hypothetical protein
MSTAAGIVFLGLGDQHLSVKSLVLMTNGLENLLL